MTQAQKIRALTQERTEWVKTTVRPFEGRVRYSNRRYLQMDVGLAREMFLQLTKAAMDVAMVIMDEVNTDNNIFAGTYQELEEKAGYSKSVIIEAMRELRQVNFIRKYKNGRWMLNPAVGIGCRSDRLDDLLDQYHRLQPYTSEKDKGGSEDVSR